jgi:hypothetical protein
VGGAVVADQRHQVRVQRWVAVVELADGTWSRCLAPMSTTASAARTVNLPTRRPVRGGGGHDVPVFGSRRLPGVSAVRLL